MTVIVRKGNVVATDSKEIFELGSMLSVARRTKQKLYRLPSNDAVIGYTGTITSETQFDQVMTDINHLLLCLKTGEALETLPSRQVNLDSGSSILVMTKTHTYQTSIETREPNKPCLWTISPATKPVIIGSGSMFFDTEELFSPTNNLEQILDTIYQRDAMVGGDQHYFDLNQLNDIGEMEK